MWLLCSVCRWRSWSCGTRPLQDICPVRAFALRRDVDTARGPGPMSAACLFSFCDVLLHVCPTRLMLAYRRVRVLIVEIRLVFLLAVLRKFHWFFSLTPMKKCFPVNGNIRLFFTGRFVAVSWGSFVLYR